MLITWQFLQFLKDLVAQNFTKFSFWILLSAMVLTDTTSWYCFLSSFSVSQVSSTPSSFYYNFFFFVHVTRVFLKNPKFLTFFLVTATTVIDFCDLYFCDILYTSDKQTCVFWFLLKSNTPLWIVLSLFCSLTL